jgi:alpha-beta hydrolase superfamily lysophospholipase
MYKYFNINEQGHSVHCKIYSSGTMPAEKAIIFCTGFAGHKDNMAAQRFSEKLLSKRKDVSVVVFNWPAHGDDVKKTLMLEDCNVYLQLVIKTLKTNYNIQEMYSYATSFGGYLVLKYISENGNPFRKIALRCPAVDMCDVLTNSVIKTDEYDRIMKGKKVQVGFDRKIIVTRDLLEALKTNDIRQRDYLDFADDILIMHGTADEVVPFNSAREFAENNVIEFIPVEGADHRFVNPVHMSLANKYTLQFFDMQ